MNRNNRHNRHKNWNNSKKPNQNNNYSEEKIQNNKKVFEPSKNICSPEKTEAMQKKLQQIQEFKAREVICPICQKPILDIPSALSDKKSGSPVHFECVMSDLEKTETVGQNEKICYIGQGRFGILYFENPRDQRHFTIKKIIEWENRENKLEWRDEVSTLFSQV